MENLASGHFGQKLVLICQVHVERDVHRRIVIILILNFLLDFFFSLVFVFCFVFFLFPP